jgi:hypothetical protein
VGIVARCMPRDVDSDGTLTVRGNDRQRPPLRYGGMPEPGAQVFVWKIEEHGGAGLAERGLIQTCVPNGRNFAIEFSIEDREPNQPLSKAVLQPLRGSSVNLLPASVAMRILEYAPPCIMHLTEEQEAWLNQNYYEVAPFIAEQQREEIDQERRRTWSLIEQRAGQRPFREALIRRDGAQCAITGCTLLTVVEACHLIPFASADPDRDNPDNGMLLRADIHLLFDRGLIAIDPISRELWLADELVGTDYEYLRVPGRRIVTGAATRNLQHHFSWRDR